MSRPPSTGFRLSMLTPSATFATGRTPVRTTVSSTWAIRRNAFRFGPMPGTPS